MEAELLSVEFLPSDRVPSRGGVPRSSGVSRLTSPRPQVRGSVGFDVPRPVPAWRWVRRLKILKKWALTSTAMRMVLRRVGLSGPASGDDQAAMGLAPFQGVRSSGSGEPPAALPVHRLRRVLGEGGLLSLALLEWSVQQIVTKMGAKVEAEGYNSGHYTVGNLQGSVNGWRSSYEEERTSNGEFFNGFITTEAVGYTSEYDKEMFKHIMLANEAAFRQQVYELHRVYRIQRNLAGQYENKEMHACPRLEYASQRNSPSQVPLHGAKTITAAAAVNNEKSQSLNFLREGSVQSSPNGFPSSEDALHTKQPMFDLELGADDYFENDKASGTKPIDFLVSSDTKQQSDAGVTLDRTEGLGRFGHNCPTLFLPTSSNLGGHHVTELNKPVFGMYMGRTNGSVSGGPHSLENPWQHSAWRSSTISYSFNKEFSKDKRANEGTSSNFFDASSRMKHEEKPLINKGKHASNISYLAPRYSDTDPRKTFNVAEERAANINQFIYQCPNSSTGWFSRSPLEASAVNNFSGHDHVHRSSHSTLVAPISSPHIGHPSVASRVGSCIVDPRTYSSNAGVQSFPSFNGSSMVNSYVCLGAVNQSIRTLTHDPKKINNSEGSYSGVPFDSLAASQQRHQVPISRDMEQKNRLRLEHPARYCHEDPDFVNGKGRNNFNLNEALSDGQKEVLVEQGRVCVGSLQHIDGEGLVSGISWPSKKALFAGSTCLEEPRRVPDSALTSVGCEAKKDKTQESAACLPPSCQKLVPTDGQAAEGVINKSGAAILNLFDLNDDAPDEDNSESSIVSHECHVTSLQNKHVKRAFVIDLDVPACEDAAATAAAEDILALSTDVTSTDTPDNMLEWFAELAVSRIDGVARQVEVQGCIGNCSDDDLDSFEALTLNLEETKFVEFCSWPLAPAVTNDEQTVSPVNLLTKPKRGQARKRRQKRDFQKDILPSMSSLCRPEIIEDIELLEGLVQMTGGSWESSFTKQRRSRGKKPKKRQPEPIEEEVEISPPVKPDGAGLEAEDRSMIGWGRTTRRCRTPRCPSGITVAAAS